MSYRSFLLASVMAIGLTAGKADAAAVYTFDLSFDGATLDGLITIDDSNANYVGGGTTTKDAVLDYSLALSKGSTSTLLTKANSSLGTMTLTYSLTLDSIVLWNISIGSGPGGTQFAGNNTSGVGFAQWDRIAIQIGGNLTPNSSLVTSPVPVPAALPLLASGLGALGFAGWRRQRKNKLAA